MFLSTPGGNGHQVNLFVNTLRSRFSSVEFLLPFMAMSAGTLWALSGDRIWMDSRAFLGPIDPQVPLRDGRFVPAQSLLLLLEQVKNEGEAAIRSGAPVPWHLIAILNGIDKKELGDAIVASKYYITMAAEFLEKYKFAIWATHKSTGAPVTPEDRKQRALEVAALLGSTERWKAHGHAITRQVAWDELRIHIDHPETVPGLERAMRRMWALCHWTFDNTPAVKVMLSQKYAFVRQVALQPAVVPA